jgi:hypothetical protein
LLEACIAGFYDAVSPSTLSIHGGFVAVVIPDSVRFSATLLGLSVGSRFRGSGWICHHRCAISGLDLSSQDLGPGTFTSVAVRDTTSRVRNVSLKPDLCATKTWTIDVIDGPIPIQLLSFKASLLQGPGGVLLEWTTVSETNNYGFEVQRAADSTGTYQTIESSFVAGNGTTIQRHSYMYVTPRLLPARGSTG